jgi:hypothetical protein
MQGPSRHHRAHLRAVQASRGPAVAAWRHWAVRLCFCRTATAMERAGPAMQAVKLRRACAGLANHGASTKHGRGGATRAARCLSTWRRMRKHKSPSPAQDRDAILYSPAARVGCESRGRAACELACELASALRVSFHCHRPSFQGGIHSLFLAERNCLARYLIVPLQHLRSTVAHCVLLPTLICRLLGPQLVSQIAQGT